MCGPKNSQLLTSSVYYMYMSSSYYQEISKIKYDPSFPLRYMIILTNLLCQTTPY